MKEDWAERELNFRRTLPPKDTYLHTIKEEDENPKKTQILKFLRHLDLVQASNAAVLSKITEQKEIVSDYYENEHYKQ